MSPVPERNDLADAQADLATLKAAARRLIHALEADDANIQAQGKTLREIASAAGALEALVGEGE